MYSYIEFLTHFSVASWWVQNMSFLLFSFFLVSSYPLFSNTVQMLRGTDLPYLPIHTFFSPLKSINQMFSKNDNYT